MGHAADAEIGKQRCTDGRSFDTALPELADSEVRGKRQQHPPVGKCIVGDWEPSLISC
jgi:hypothetical protein